MPAESAWDENDFDTARHRAAQTEAARQASAADIDPAPSRFGARTLGALQLATPGCQVYANPELRRDADDRPPGGVLLNIVDTVGAVDPETGEIPVRRTFRCWDPYHGGGRGKAPGSIVHVPEDVCGPDSVTMLDLGLVTAVTGQMARQYVERRGKSGRLPLLGYDFDLVHDLGVLARALKGGLL